MGQTIYCSTSEGDFDKIFVSEDSSIISSKAVRFTDSNNDSIAGINISNNGSLLLSSNDEIHLTDGFHVGSEGLSYVLLSIQACTNVVNNDSGNVVPIDSNLFQQELLPKVFEYITPDFDGTNDYLNVIGLENYTSFEMTDDMTNDMTDD